MDDSIQLESAHAKLAREGINILSVTRFGKNSYAVMFEYSWHDPEMDGKLHWSKSMVECSYDGSPYRVLLSVVQKAREELENGR